MKEALIIGIDQYENEKTLAYAAKDAQDVANLLAMPEYGFEVKLLLDTEATQDHVRLSINQLFASPSDVKLFYFAGHGNDMASGIRLVMSDSALEKPGIDLELLREKATKTKANVVLILDSCFSGAADPGEIFPFHEITEDGIDHKVGIFSSGKILLAACGNRASARESDTYGHGLFTHYLLEGLLGRAANARGIITPHSLYEYIADKLNEDGRQRPIFKGQEAGLLVLGGGFPTNSPITIEETSTDRKVIEEIESKAKQHLDNYMAQINVGYSNWKETGFKKAGQLLSPMLRWFNTQLNAYPELRSRTEFTQAHSEALSRLAQLGMVSEGTMGMNGMLKKRLGAGAFGTVWQVDNNGVPLAYKVYHSNELAIREKVARFRHGYEAMKQLDHPNIVKVQEFTDAPVGFFMDYIDGPNLRDFAFADTEPVDIIQILLTIADTLRHAHGRNVLHRDVKPENIVINVDYELKSYNPFLTDFDLAWFSTATQVTKEALGVMAYAAPEQLTKPASKMAHSPTTDIYSFGQLCFYAVTKSDPVPFREVDNCLALSQRIGHWASAKAVEEFTALYKHCSQAEPNQRPQSLGAISAVLFRVKQLLQQINPEQSISVEEFRKGVVHATIGPTPELSVSENSFKSKSRRTMVVIDDVAIKNNRIDYKLVFHQSESMMPGTNYSKAHKIMNARVSVALQKFGHIDRHNGRDGSYSITLSILNKEARMKSIEECREIVDVVIDALERI